MKIFHILFSLIILFTGACRRNERGVEAVTAPAPEPLHTLGALARPAESAADLDPLLDRMQKARLVLLGEASHGTSEFYSWRAAISRRLIEEKGFDFVAVEGDWAGLHKLNRYVKDLPGAAADARAVMKGFTRWPAWMWANEETLELIEWMRSYNLDRPLSERAGFYGMDVYGDDEARRKVLEGLAGFDAGLADRARSAYQPFDVYQGDAQQYARALIAGAEPLETNALAALRLVKEEATALREECPLTYFHILQSAFAVKSAERHQRAMTRRGPESWNARADHFYGTVERLLEFYGEASRGIAWAHNTHVGDARATAMARGGQRNIGQIAREAMGRDEVFSLGFGTHRGTVKAGRSWGGPQELMTVPPGEPDSYEDLMNRLEQDTALFIFDKDDERLEALREPRGHRAIGVIYHPEHERRGNYVPTVLADRYDAFLFIAETRALTPVQR